MAPLSICDGVVANDTVLSKRSRRAALGQLFQQLAEGKSIAHANQKVFEDFFTTVRFLQFRSRFEKLMFYRTLAMIAVHESFSGIPLDEDCILCIHTIFKKQAPQELTKLTIEAIDVGSPYTVLYNDLIEYANRKPGYTHLRWYWFPFLENWKKTGQTTLPQKEQVIANTDIVGTLIRRRKNDRIITKRYYRELLLELKGIDQNENSYSQLISNLLIFNERNAQANLVIDLEENPIVLSIIRRLFNSFLMDCFSIRMYLSQCAGLFLYWMKEKTPLIFDCLFADQLVERMVSMKYSFNVVATYLPKVLIQDLYEYFLGRTNNELLIDHLLAGNNIRKFEQLPFPLTKKMAHYFTTSNERNLSLAYFKAFVYGLGGNYRLMYSINNCWQSPADDFEFLKSLVLFFNKYPDLERLRLNRLIGYIRHRRMEDRMAFSLKGRTLNSLQRLADDFYNRMELLRSIRQSKDTTSTWFGSTCLDWNYFDGNHWYAIFQLFTSNELVKESIALSHCVRSYVAKCKTGRSSIWSLRRKDKNDWTSLVTIELNDKNRVVQAKAKYNALPDGMYVDMIKEWALREGIDYLRS